MEEIAITTTIEKTPEDMMADFSAKIMWVIFACMSAGVVVLIETLILNRGCTL